MPELKVVCNCGQKYKFDVEPVNGRMPHAVNCPVCGIDGTHLAEALLAQMPPPSLAAMPPIGTIISAGPMPPPIPIPPPVPAQSALRSGLQLQRSAPPPATAAPPAVIAAAQQPRPGPPRPVGPAPAVPKYMQDNPALQNNSFVLGTLGALGGALIAVGFMVGTHVFLGFSFPLFGTVMGAIIGFGARLGYKGTDSTLGGMSALVAAITIGTTLFLMFGILGILFSLMSWVIGVMAAFKIASG